jgi:antitoxin (DNA-binding transcriptional repressor) of toxin-antitoxin stability system
MYRPEIDKEISIRQLGKKASGCIAAIEKTGEPVLVKRHEEPVAYIVSLADAARLGLASVDFPETKGR